MEKENSETVETLIPLEKRRDEARQYLLQYGIKNYSESDLDGLIDAPPCAYLRFIMKNLDDPQYLPKLGEMLKKFVNEGLVRLPEEDEFLHYAEDDDFVYYDDEHIYYGDNVIMWAADSEYSYEKLMLLEGCFETLSWIWQYIDYKNSDGLTALHLAVIKGYCENTIWLLVRNWDANINAQDNNLWTPLHYAASVGNLKLWVRLTEMGAKISIKNNEGVTPQDMADRLDVFDAW